MPVLVIFPTRFRFLHFKKNRFPKFPSDSESNSTDTDVELIGEENKFVVSSHLYGSVICPACHSVFKYGLLSFLTSFTGNYRSDTKRDCVNDKWKYESFITRNFGTK